jgi:hypothetical protein
MISIKKPGKQKTVKTEKGLREQQAFPKELS